MVSSINFDQYDIDNNGVVNATDLVLAQAQGITIPEEIQLKILNGTTDEEEDGLLIDTPPALEPLETIGNIARAKKELDAYKVYCDEVIAKMDAQLPGLTEKFNKLKEQEERVSAQYEAKAAEVTVLQTELENAYKAAIAMSQTLDEETDHEVDKTVEETIREYQRGTYGERDLNEVIQENLGSVGVDTSKVNSLIANGDLIGGIISSRCSEISIIGGELRNVSIQLNQVADEITRCNLSKSQAQQGKTNADTKISELNTLRQAKIAEFVDKYYVAPTGGDPAAIGNAQVQKLGEFLDAKEIDTFVDGDAKDKDAFLQVIANAFGGTAISVGGNGSLSVPYGHDDQSTAIFNKLVTEVQRVFGNGADRCDIGRCDPIGFEIGEDQVEFIIDRNGDEVFNGMEEFLGAKDGWSEMFQYDDNKDGKIAGDELDDMKVLQKKANGQSLFASASDIGIESIDLNSFTSKNQEQSDGSLLAGNFNLNFKGTTVQGSQTYDTKESLNVNFGSTFGKKINNKNIEQTQIVVGANNDGNPFSYGNFDEQSLLTNVQGSSAQARSLTNVMKQQAESKIEDYTYTGSAEEDKKAEDKKAEDKKTEAKKTEDKKTQEQKPSVEITGEKSLLLGKKKTQSVTNV